jgi:hypothetical protein
MLREHCIAWHTPAPLLPGHDLKIAVGAWNGPRAEHVSLKESLLAVASSVTADLCLVFFRIYVGSWRGRHAMVFDELQHSNGFISYTSEAVRVSVISCG